MRRLFVVAAATSLVLIATPAAHAQINDDPASDGTTGLFMVPRAGTVEEGTWSLGGYYFQEAREEGDARIRSLGVMGSYGLGYRVELYIGFRPYVEIDRRFTAEAALLFMMPNLTGLGINDHPFAFGPGTYDGVGDVIAGFKYKFAGDPYEYDGLALQGWVGFPTSEAKNGIGCGCLQVGGRVIGSLEAWELIGWNLYLGYNWWDTPHIAEKIPAQFDPGIAKWFITPEFQYGVGLQLPTRAKLQFIGEWIGRVTKRDVTSAYTGGDDLSLLQAGVRLTTEGGLAVNVATNYNYTINVRDPAWQPDRDAVSDALRRWGWYAGLSYSTSRRVPLQYSGTELANVPILNRPPTLECRAERASIREGESVRIMGTASDPDGDPIAITWDAAAGSVSPTTGDTVTWSSRGVSPGAGNIVGRASDSYGGTADCSVRISVEAPPPPPEPIDLTFVCSEFRSGNARIDNRCKAVLDDVALQLRQNPGAMAVITGHSDSAGSADRNDQVSMERADNAKTYLVDTHGIDPSRIETGSMGSRQPMADNNTRAGRAQNRRIEIVVTIPGQ